MSEGGMEEARRVNAAELDTIMTESGGAAGAGADSVDGGGEKKDAAASEARTLLLLPAGRSSDADCRGWRYAMDSRGGCRDPLSILRAVYPPGLHPQAVDDFEKWAIGADARLCDGKMDDAAVRTEYEAALAATIRQSAEFKAADADAYLSRIIPREYRRPIDRTAPRVNWRAFDAVQAWRPEVKRRPGLLVAGDTGRGKTRAIYARLADLHKAEGLKFIALTSDALKQSIIDLSRIASAEYDNSNVGENGPSLFMGRSGSVYTPRGEFLPKDSDTLGAFIAKLQSVPVLFVDDLGQAKMTPLYGEKLFALVEHRTNRGLPIIATAQSRPDALVRKLAGWEGEFADTARCLVRRLMNYCTPVDFGFDDDADGGGAAV